MGKYGFKSGYGKFQNIQAGTDTISDGTTISFEEAMKGTPSVVLFSLQDTNVELADSESVDETGFKATPSGSATDLKFSWVAFDDSL